MQSERIVVIHTGPSATLFYSMLNQVTWPSYKSTYSGTFLFQEFLTPLMLLKVFINGSCDDCTISFTFPYLIKCYSNDGQVHEFNLTFNHQSNFLFEGIFIQRYIYTADSFVLQLCHFSCRSSWERILETS